MEYLEPIIAAIAAFLLGFAWYTALFGKAWQAATGVTDEQAQSGMLQTHGLSFLMMVIIAFGMNIVINLHSPEDQTLAHGAFHGCMFALFYGLPLMAINLLYQKKPLKLFLIDGGYALAFFSLMGAVMGALNLGG